MPYDANGNFSPTGDYVNPPTSTPTSTTPTVAPASTPAPAQSSSWGFDASGSYGYGPGRTSSRPTPTPAPTPTPTPATEATPEPPKPSTSKPPKGPAKVVEDTQVNANTDAGDESPSAVGSSANVTDYSRLNPLATGSASTAQASNLNTNQWWQNVGGAIGNFANQHGITGVQAPNINTTPTAGQVASATTASENFTPPKPPKDEGGKGGDKTPVVTGNTGTDKTPGAPVGPKPPTGTSTAYVPPKWTTTPAPTYTATATTAPKAPTASKVPSAITANIGTGIDKVNAPTAGKVPTAIKSDIGATIDNVAGPKGPSGIGKVGYTDDGQAQVAGAEASYGKSAEDALTKAMKAGQGYASQQASIAANQAGSQATASARAAGLSPAQAALMAGQGVESTYGQAYSSNLADATKQYANLAKQMGDLGTTERGQALQKYKNDLDQAVAKGQLSQAEYQTAMQKYDTDVAKETAERAQDLQKYQSDIQQNLGLGQLTQSQYATQMQQYGVDVGAQTAERSQDIQKYQADIQQSLGLGQLNQQQYATQMQQYGVDVGAMTAKQAQDIQKYGMDISKWSQESQNELQRQTLEQTGRLTQQAQDLQARGIDVSQYLGELNAANQRYATDKGVDVQTREADQKLFTQFINFAASAGAALLGLVIDSDKRGKTDIKDGWGVLEAVTAKVKPKSFTYKQGIGDGGSHVGVMAQDLEKTPLSGAVKTGADGMKRVDTGHLSLGNTAMISELNKKLDGVIAHLKGGK
jgi:hypothetical protein